MAVPSLLWVLIYYHKRKLRAVLENYVDLIKINYLSLNQLTVGFQLI